jgi:CRP/FNR family transcriptional regulator, cyclic AMP receptor protein
MSRQELAQLPLFQGLTTDQLEQLSPMLEPCTFEKDQVIFEQGRNADFLYILLTGEVIVRYKPYDGPPLTVSRIAPGGVFGWSAAMMREVYTSSAISSTLSEAYRISGQNLRALCECNPDAGSILLDRLASVITERLHKTHTQILAILSQGMEADGDCGNRTNGNGRK